MTYKIFILVLGVFLTTGKATGQDTLRFGRVRVGDAAKDTLLVSNQTMVDLMLSNPHVTTPVFQLAPDAFSGVSKRVPSGGGEGIPVSFSPTARGAVSGQFSVASGNGVLRWTLLGEGVDEVIVINEVLADPPSGLVGDANQDGVRSSSADEFVEILNTGKYPLEISGWQLSDRKASTSKRFTFPDGTWIKPSEYIVLFGGGNADGFDGQVFIDDGKIGGGLSNSNDAVFLINPITQDTLAQAEWTSLGGKDQALVRYPEGVGEMQLHTTFPGNGSRFSPGHKRVLLSNLVLSPQDTTIALGETVAVTILGEYSDGKVADVDDYLQWAVSDSTRLLHIGSSVWQAQAPGLVTLRVQVEHSWSEMQIVITPPEIVEVEIVQRDTLLLLSEGLSLGLVGRLGDQSQYDIGEDVVWTAVPANGAKFQGPAVRFASTGRFDLIGRHKEWADTIAVDVFAKGDINADGTIDLVDAVRLVHLILGIDPEGQGFELRAADLDDNETIDIRDLVGVIACFNKLPVVATKRSGAVKGAWWVDDGIVMIQTNVPVRGVVGTIWGKLRLGDGDGQYISAQEDQGQAVQFVQMSTDESGIESHIDPHAVGGLSGQVNDIEVVAFSGAKYALSRRAADSGKSRIFSSFPNPFNPDTVIEYEVALAGLVSLSIYTIAGQEVTQLFSQPVESGVFQVIWRGVDAQGQKVASGVYFARLFGDGFESVHKMVLMR